jgi:hypothetical protein
MRIFAKRHIAQKVDKAIRLHHFPIVSQDSVIHFSYARKRSIAITDYVSVVEMWVGKEKGVIHFNRTWRIIYSFYQSLSSSFSFRHTTLNCLSPQSWVFDLVVMA